MKASDLLQAMLDAGAPIEAAMIALRALEEKDAEIEQRRSVERERKRRQRAKDTDTDTDGTVTGQSRDTDGTVTDTPPLSRPPNEEKSNPPTHTPPDMTSRARAGKFPCPKDCDPMDWTSFLQARKTRMTDGAYRAITTKLEKCADAGWPPGPILTKAVERGWQTVFIPDEMKAGQNGRTNGTSYGKPGLRGSRPNPALDMVLEAERELQAEAIGENPWPDWSAGTALSPH